MGSYISLIQLESSGQISLPCNQDHEENASYAMRESSLSVRCWPGVDLNVEFREKILKRSVTGTSTVEQTPYLTQTIYIDSELEPQLQI